MKYVASFLLLCALAAVLPPVVQLVWEYLTGERS